MKLNMLKDEEFSRIKTAFLQYGFLVFPQQFLTAEENIEFGQRFGQLEFGGLPMANVHRNEDGSYSDVIPLDSQRMRTNVENIYAIGDIIEGAMLAHKAFYEGRLAVEAALGRTLPELAPPAAPRLVVG